MKPTMSRGDAIRALIAGRNVERLTPNGQIKWPMRWSDDGPQIMVDDNGTYENEYVADCHGFVYCEAPRTFLGVWKEVETFKDAEKANESGDVRTRCVLGQNGYACLDTRADDVEGSSGFWVRRIPGK